MEGRARFEARLDAAGLGLRAALAIADYDAAVPPAWRSERWHPGARTALLVASGGRALWRAFESSPDFGRGADPLDAFTRRQLEGARSALGPEQASAPRLAGERHGERFADFVELGRLAGLGAPSRLGLLVHPEYGPWLSLRGLILLRPVWDPPAAPLSDFDPCPGCPAPCAAACPSGAPTPRGFDLARCDDTRRRRAGCAEACDARRACVLGREHAYRAEALAHHMRVSRPA